MGGRLKVFKAIAHTLMTLVEKGNALTKQLKSNTALATCEDVLNVTVNEVKAYIVVDPFEAWVMDHDTEDDVAKTLRPYLSEGSGAEREGSSSGGGGKTPAAEIDLTAERLRIDDLIKSKEALEATNKKAQDERKAANLAKTKEERAVSAPPTSPHLPRRGHVSHTRPPPTPRALPPRPALHRLLRRSSRRLRLPSASSRSTPCASSRPLALRRRVVAAAGARGVAAARPRAAPSARPPRWQGPRLLPPWPTTTTTASGLPRPLPLRPSLRPSLAPRRPRRASPRLRTPTSS